MVYRLNRPAELRPLSGFHLDESDGPIPLDNEIDVAMTGAKPPLNDTPAAAPKPPLRYTLPELSEGLPGR